MNKATKLILLMLALSVGLVNQSAQGVLAKEGEKSSQSESKSKPQAEPIKNKSEPIKNKSEPSQKQVSTKNEGSEKGNSNNAKGDSKAPPPTLAKGKNDGDGGKPAGEAQSSPPKALSWGDVKSFTEQKKNESVPDLAKSRFQLVIIDPAKNGNDNQGVHPPADVQAIKSGPGGKKLALAHLSIGEVENTRSYWKNQFDNNLDGKPDPGAPTWIGPHHPAEQSEYMAKYWEPAWLGIMEQRIDQIVAEGFDGVTLKGVDAYRYWLPTRPTAAAEMITLVETLSAYGKAKSGNPNFGIFPEGAPELATDPGYLAAITGVENRGNWYEGNQRKDQQDSNEITQGLDKIKHAGKLVLVKDFVNQPSLVDDFYKKAQSKGYIPYATVPTEDRLVINKGHEPENTKPASK